MENKQLTEPLLWCKKDGLHQEWGTFDSAGILDSRSHNSLPFTILVRECQMEIQDLCEVCPLTTLYVEEKKVVPVVFQVGLLFGERAVLEEGHLQHRGGRERGVREK